MARFIEKLELESSYFTNNKCWTQDHREIRSVFRRCRVRGYSSDWG